MDQLIVIGISFGLLFVSAFIGGFIGLTREKHSRAGMATHSIITVTATAATLAVFMVNPIDGNFVGDLWRMPAALVGAIGFVGTGVMWKDEDGVKHGLTTAATLFASVIIGILFGLSMDFNSFAHLNDEIKYVNVTMLALAFMYPLAIALIFTWRRIRYDKRDELINTITKKIENLQVKIAGEQDSKAINNLKSRIHQEKTKLKIIKHKSKNLGKPKKDDVS